MGDGAKEDPAQCKEPRFLAKAGWVKKASGRVLASYKDRFIHVEKTELVVYESEDLKNCVERLDLENYNKCLELKSTFSKKHRLILIRSPKAGNKIHDVKFQVPTADEKEAWLKALSDGINRAKNKIFDEVKIDETSNLEHVTRSRPKGNRNRRPPTRIHMKEVSVVSSDGILRLDLDLDKAVMPNGTSQATVDGTEIPKEANNVPVPLSSTSKDKSQGASDDEEAQAEPDVPPQKKVIKPPMPPSKMAKPISVPEKEAEDEDGTKKALLPPMPPCKGSKPCAAAPEEATEEAEADKMAENSPEARKTTGPPPTPPNKPSSSSTGNLAEASQSRPKSHLPTPPSKEMKPSHPADKLNQVGQDTPDESKEKTEDERNEETGTPVEKEEAPYMGTDYPAPCADGHVSEEESGASHSDPQVLVLPPPETTEPIRKSQSPLLHPKKMSSKLPEFNTQHTEDDTSGALEGEDPTPSLQTEEQLSSSEVPVVMVSLTDPVADSVSQSPLLCRLPREKKMNVEEKSVDSGQHSDADSEVSVNEDTLAASTAALRGSSAGLDMLDTSEDDIHNYAGSRPAQATSSAWAGSTCQHLESASSVKPSIKTRSVSFGDLLSDAVLAGQVRHQTNADTGRSVAPRVDIMTLEMELTLEMEKTGDLLSRVSQSQQRGHAESSPEDLLAKAMEKLKKADYVLREVQKLKLAKKSNNRNSW
ncbi:uncharacterized protein plekho2 [Aulostomus maculatus]